MPPYQDWLNNVFSQCRPIFHTHHYTFLELMKTILHLAQLHKKPRNTWHTLIRKLNFEASETSELYLWELQRNISVHNDKSLHA